ncbi:MAG: calcium-binding protein [Myxococcales bacterium]|nr:calcium-binding protein [Myxococcales bacterium]
MLNKIRIAIAVTGTLLVGGATVAMAHPGGGDRADADIIQKYDANKDGKLDDTERAAMRADFKAKHAERKAQMLARFDTNKDGKLDDAERAVMREQRAAEEFKKLDTDGNGSISLDEFKKGEIQGHQGRGGFGHGHHGRGERDKK